MFAASHSLPILATSRVEGRGGGRGEGVLLDWVSVVSGVGCAGAVEDAAVMRHSIRETGQTCPCWCILEPELALADDKPCHATGLWPYTAPLWLDKALEWPNPAGPLPYRSYVAAGWPCWAASSPNMASPLPDTRP